MKRWAIGIVAALCALGVGWYFISPGWALRGLRDAVVAGDRDELAERVDFPAVRESLKAQVLVAMQAEMAKQKDNPFAGLGMALATSMVGPMIDNMVTPDGMKALVQQGKFEKPGQTASQETTASTQWDISRVSFDKFKAMPKVGDAEKRPVLMFKRDGLGWKLNDIQMPQNRPVL